MEIVTYKIRIKERNHLNWLDSQARNVNLVWNYCNDLSNKAWKKSAGPRKWLSKFDLNPYLKGASKEIDLPQATILGVGHEHANKRQHSKRSKLKWRTSKGSKKSLGWIPVTVRNLK